MRKLKTVHFDVVVAIAVVSFKVSSYIIIQQEEEKLGLPVIAREQRDREKE